MARPRPETAPAATTIPRRRFLVASSASAAAGVLGISCTNEDEPVSEPVTSSSTSAPDRARRFFSPREALTIEAATARILPGTPEDPGAREAEVVVYIDALLASGGWADEPIYRLPPFVPVSARGASGDGDDAAEPEIDTTSFGVITRPSGVAERFGLQSMLTPADVYRAAIPALDAHASQRFGSVFAELPEAEQDTVLQEIEDGAATTFPTEPTGPDFFAMLRQHTIEGMFSDPIYGGNRDLVGWKLIGWPAAQRAYSVQELRTPAPPRPPQGIADLPHYHRGTTDRDEPVFPLAGSDQARHDHNGGR